MDEIAPLAIINECKTVNNQTTNLFIKPKIILLRKLLKKLKSNPSKELRDQIKHLNIGNSKSLWDAVNVAKNINKPKLPVEMTK